MAEYDQTLADVLKSTVRDAQDLIRGEIALAKTEFREEVRRIGVAVAALAAGAVAALIAVVFLLTALAWGLAAAFAWPAWTGFAVVSLLVAVAAVVLLVMGRSRLARERHMPLTVDTLKENMEWMRARTS